MLVYFTFSSPFNPSDTFVWWFWAYLYHVVDILKLHRLVKWFLSLLRNMKVHVTPGLRFLKTGRRLSLLIDRHTFCFLSLQCQTFFAFWRWNFLINMVMHWLSAYNFLGRVVMVASCASHYYSFLPHLLSLFLQKFFSFTLLFIFDLLLVLFLILVHKLTGLFDSLSHE